MPALFQKNRKLPGPSPSDLEIWKKINQDLLDWLYTGLTGRFQISGHRQIDRWAASHTEKTVLEVGCGHGHHLCFARQTYRRYIGLDIEGKFLKTFQKRFAGPILVQGDTYALPFSSQSVDCVLSIYNFEHLRRLPDSLLEIHRVLKAEGELIAGLPAEGGFLYSLGRRIFSKRYMERKYKIDYDAIVRWEHCNTCREVIEEIGRHFVIRTFRYLPFFIPSVHLNVIIVFRALPK